MMRRAFGAALLIACCVSLTAHAETVRPRYTGEIMPTPKRVVYEDSFLPLVKDGEPLVSALAGSDPGPGEQTALAEIESLLGVKLPPAKDGDRCVISIGRTSVAEASVARRPVDVRDEGFDREGYVLRFERDDGGREHVILYGPGKRGTLYAAMSFCQLVRQNGGVLEARRVDVTDWPTFLVRCTPLLYTAPNAHDDIDFRSRIKVNMGIFGVGMPLPDPKPGEPTPQELTSSVDMVSYGVRTARMGFLELINPYTFKSEGQINLNNPDDIDRLTRCFDAGLSAGAEGIMLCLDDTCREITYEELIRFRDTGYAHAYLYTKLYDALKPRYPDRLFLFLPVPYGGIPGDQMNKDYMNILGALLPQDVGLVWSGPGGQASRVDQGEIELYSSFVGGRRPFYWDNSAMWVHKLLQGQFLDPYRTKLAPGMAHRLFARGTHLLTPCDEVFLLTWADCLWNPEAYDADRSWRRALAMLAGQENVEKLIEYNQLFTRALQGFFHGECLVDDLSEYDSAIRRMEAITADMSGVLPKSLGSRMASHTRSARQKLTDWESHLAGIRKDYAAAERDFSKAASDALAVPTLKWRNTQGNGWTASTSGVSVGLSGERLEYPCLLVNRDPVAFPSRFDGITAEAEVALPRTPNAGLAFLIEDGDVRPVPSEGAKGSITEALLTKTIRLNGKVVWQSDEMRGPCAETVVMGWPKKLAGSKARLSITVANCGWSSPRIPERVCLVGPIFVKPENVPAPDSRPMSGAIQSPLVIALEALKQLPGSFNTRSYNRKSYSGLLESIIRDAALRSVESRIPLELRIAAGRGMWNDGRPDTAIECLLRKGEVVHLRPGGAISVVGISEPMSAETEAALTKDRPLAFCLREAGKIIVDGDLADWSSASWTRLSENVSVASLDYWDPIKKFVNFAEDQTAKVHGPDLVERTGRERFVSFNPYFSETDTAAKFAAKWDSRSLYLAADVTDDALSSIDPDRTFRGDHVEFFVDVLDDQTDLPWKDDFWYQVSILRSLDSARGTGDGPSGKPVRGFESRAVWRLEPRHRGYVVEMAIPWTELGLVPYEGHRIGFNVRVRDRDSDRECKTIWWRAVKEPYRIQAPKRTFGWGELLLVKQAS